MFNLGDGRSINLAKVNDIWPFVAIACKNCGLTEFFSAAIIGVGKVRLAP